MPSEIESCKWLFLRQLEEPEENSLRLVVEEAKADGSPEDIEVSPGKFIKGTVPIESDSSCRLFEIIWPFYVAYTVRNESYTSWDDTEQWDGRLFRVYSKSHFRDFVSIGTFANNEYPGPLQHWCVLCLRHLVDVVSHVEPVVRKLKSV